MDPDFIDGIVIDQPQPFTPGPPRVLIGLTASPSPHPRARDPLIGTAHGSLAVNPQTRRSYLILFSLLRQPQGRESEFWNFDFSCTAHRELGFLLIRILSDECRALLFNEEGCGPSSPRHPILC